MNATLLGAAKSKLMWLGLATTIFGALQTYSSALAPYLDPKTFGLVTAGIGITVMVLRFLTSQSLADKGTSP